MSGKSTRVKILKCTVKNDWYENKIGFEFWVKHYNDTYYYVTTAGVAGQFKIRKSDCKTIEFKPKIFG